MPTLVVQMGHCYRKTGATGTAGEQAYAAAVAEACRALLDGRGGWWVRPILADNTSALYRGDAFVAVHCDGSTSSAARGASCGYRTPEGQVFGQAWKRAYEARGWVGFRPDNYTPALAGYYGTGTAVSVGNRRAIIIECGFLTNPADRAALTGPGGATRVAAAIGDALGIPHDHQPEQEIDMALTGYERDMLERVSNRVNAVSRFQEAIDAEMSGIDNVKYRLQEPVEIVTHIEALETALAAVQADVAELKARPAADVDEAQLAAELESHGGLLSAAEFIDILNRVGLRVGPAA